MDDSYARIDSNVLSTLYDLYNRLCRGRAGPICGDNDHNLSGSSISGIDPCTRIWPKTSRRVSMESRLVACEDLGRQVLTHGHAVGPQAMCERIEQVTLDDVCRVARKILSGQIKNLGSGTGRPTIFGMGENVQGLGDVATILNRHGVRNWSSLSYSTSPPRCLISVERCSNGISPSSLWDTLSRHWSRAVFAV